jgi:drug/metabolite transporter (DMT)-like permease
MNSSGKSSAGTGIDNHTQMPARPDLIRLIIGVCGVGSSGPLIAMSAMPVPTLIFWRNFGGALLTLPFALRHKVTHKGVQLAALAGVLLALHFVGFFLSMRMTSVAAGTALAATQPIYAAFFVKLTGGHIPGKAWVGMFISFLGVLLVTGVDLQLDKKSFLGDLAALIAGALAAAYMLVGSRAQQQMETTSYTTICYFVCSITALPMALLLGYEVIHFSAREWWILLGLILGAQLLGHTVFNSTLKRVSPAIVSMIVFFEVPVAAILAFIFDIGKQPTLSIIPGVVLILLGCGLVVLRNTKESGVEL